MKINRRSQGKITPELRSEAIKAAREGTLTHEEVANAFGISRKSLQRWLQDADEQEASQPLTTEEKAELRQLRAQNKKLQQENEILKKFAAFSERQKR